MAVAGVKTGQKRVMWDAALLERMNERVNEQFEAGDYLRVPEERKRLRRYIEFEKLAMLAICGHLASIPSYADLGRLSEIAYENVLLAMQFERRNHEHPHGTKEEVDAGPFEDFAKALERPDTIAELYGSLFSALTRAQIEAYQRHCEASDQFFNRPTSKILEQAIAVKQKQLRWGEGRYRKLLAALPAKQQAAVSHRVEAFGQYLTWMGGVDGALAGRKPRIKLGAMEPIPTEVNFDPAFKFDQGYLSRDETLHWRNARPRFDGEDQAGKEVFGPLYQMYSYCCEIDIFLQFALIAYRADRDLPLEFYQDTTRQMWDEFRHTSMGQRAMRKLGFEPMDLIRPMRWPMFRQLTAAENYAWITQTGEACSLTGKHVTRKYFIGTRNYHTQTLIEWDISDESQHVRYGAKWLKEMIKRDKFEGTPKQFVIHATDKMNWLSYQNFKRLDIIPEGAVEPQPYKGCLPNEMFSA